MSDFKARFIMNFIKDDRWHYIADGLKVTLIVTFCAVLIGVVLGFLLAIVRSTYDKTGKLKLLNLICQIYITVIRGTPVVVQLLIIYFVIFASVDVSKTIVAILAFGMNSSAYVAEIFRSGIMAVDNGQFEAGRSLGFNYRQTMIYIIMPQAFKNVLPALGNEFIVLLKRDFCCRIYCPSGSDKGRRYHPKQNLRCAYAADGSCDHLPGYGYDLQ